MATNTGIEVQTDVLESPMPTDYVVVSNPEHTAGIIFIEARIQDDVELEDLELVYSSHAGGISKVFNRSQVQDELQKELSKKDQVYDVGQDLLADSYSTHTNPP